MSVEFKYAVVGVLIGATVALAVVCIYQGLVIAAQREVIVEMYRYIHAGCPTAILH